MTSRQLRLSKWRWACLCLGLICAAGTGVAVAASAPALPEVVATVNGQPIAAAELEKAAEGDLARLERQRYEVFEKQLNLLIEERLIGLEAARLGVSAAEFEAKEIVAKVTPVTPEAAKTFYEANKQRIRQPYEQIETRLLEYLQQQAQHQRRQELLQDLRQRYPIKIALHPPKVQVSVDDDPFKGPEDAPVTVIEFSDFQCPYCRRVQPTLQQLFAEYEGKIKIVYRDFPLRQAHPQAQKAAEAAQCAAEQEQFWPYHDKLFVVSSLQVEELKQYAKELGLDTERFNTCLDSDKYVAEIEKDLQDGVKAGVSATPSFFINGIPLSGAAPYEQFKTLVDNALEQSRHTVQSN